MDMFIKRFLAGNADGAAGGQRGGGVTKGEPRSGAGTGEAPGCLRDEAVDARVRPAGQGVIVHGQLEGVARGDDAAQAQPASAEPELRLRRAGTDLPRLFVGPRGLGEVALGLGCRGLGAELVVCGASRLGDLAAQLRGEGGAILEVDGDRAQQDLGPRIDPEVEDVLEVPGKALINHLAARVAAGNLVRLKHLQAAPGAIAAGP